MNENYSQEIERRGYSAVETATNTMIRKAYFWMCAALAITGLTAYYTAITPAVLNWVFAGKWTIIGLIVAEFALVIGLTAAFHKMSAMMATLMFCLYSVINGLTLSSIFLVYSINSISTAFFTSAATFGVMAIYGSVTKKDLTRLGSLCFMAVIGLVIAMLVNIFLQNSVLDMIISGVGVLVFVGLTAWDAQKIKAMLYNAEENEATTKLAVYGALSLYLDFINLFLYILRIFGSRK